MGDAVSDDKAPKKDDKSDTIKLYHYTDVESAGKIFASEEIKQSEWTSTTDDASFGSGTYLTSKGPEHSSADVAKNNYDGSTQYWRGKEDKTSVAFEFDIPKKDVQHCEVRDRDVYKTDGNLKLPEDYKVYVRGKTFDNKKTK